MLRVFLTLQFYLQQYFSNKLFRTNSIFNTNEMEADILIFDTKVGTLHVKTLFTFDAVVAISYILKKIMFALYFD